MTGDRNMDEWDAAYLLGALTAEEATEYERYLAGVPQHADSRESEGIPAILDILSPEEALALIGERPASELSGQPATQPASLAAAAHRHRSRRARMATAFASAAAFLLVGGIVGYAVIPRESSAGIALQAMAAGERDGVTASLAVSDEPWGTRLDWQCQYTKDWASKVSSYDLIVTTKDGAESTVASWSPSGDVASNLAAATVIPTSDIRSVTIREAGTATPLAITTLG